MLKHYNWVAFIAGCVTGAVGMVLWRMSGWYWRRLR